MAAVDQHAAGTGGRGMEQVRKAQRDVDPQKQRVGALAGQLGATEGALYAAGARRAPGAKAELPVEQPKAQELGLRPAGGGRPVVRTWRASE